MPPPGGIRTSLSFTMRGGPVGGYLSEQAFQTQGGAFSPGTPLTPPDPQPVRALEFRPGTNLIWTPRANEAFSFEELRAFSNVELVRLAIETRKDQIERMNWRVKVRDQRKIRSDSDERIRRVEKFWRKPDGDLHFATWLRKSMDDLLVLDAPAFEMRRSRAGKLIGLDIRPGDTFKILVDHNGLKPQPPLPAYQQVLYGRIWNNLTTKDLLYVPRNPRPNRLYGCGPVEQIVITINMALQRQASQLFHFGIGNIPSGILTAPEGWSPDQISQYQEWFDSRLSGNLGEKQKVVWVPSGSKYQNFKEALIKDEFDEWLARIVCYAFSLPPTPFIKGMNRATAETQDQTALEEGREPFLLWWKRIADDIIAEELDAPDLEWAWEINDDLDPLKQSQIDDIRLRNGSLSINQVRDRYGEIPVPGGDKNRIYLATGAVELTDNDAAADVRQAQAEAELELIRNPPPTVPGGSAKPKNAKSVTYATGQSRGASAGTGRPKKSMSGRTKEPGKT